MSATKSTARKNSPPFRTGYVALIGRPNVGKSTLLNRIMGQKISIVSDKPQTTRISILGIHTTDKGQIIFVDNPGIHKPLHGLNRRMMSFVFASLETADVICLMIDAAEGFGHGDEFVLEAMKKVSKPFFLLINKVDIVRKDGILLLIDKYKDLLPFKEIIPISALRGTNVDVLERLLYDYLPATKKLYSDEEVSDQSERFLLAEIIREKLLAHVEKELPWVTAVYIDSMEIRDGAQSAAREEGGEVDEEEGEAEEPEEEEADKLAEKEGPETGARKKPEGAVAAPAAQPELAGKSGEDKEKRPVVYIKATIFVERDNHRKIVLGRHGQTIKIIGIEARREIQEILETRVYLDLHVKVKPRWRDSADVLDLIEGQKAEG